MKIMVSSKSLYSALNRHIRNGMGSGCLKAVRLHENWLVLDFGHAEVNILVEVLQYSGPEVNQENIRWDWLKETLSKVPEQPVTLEIKENIVNLIFQF